MSTNNVVRLHMTLSEKSEKENWGVITNIIVECDLLRKWGLTQGFSLLEFGMSKRRPRGVYNMTNEKIKIITKKMYK